MQQDFAAIDVSSYAEDEFPRKVSESFNPDIGAPYFLTPQPERDEANSIYL